MTDNTVGSCGCEASCASPQAVAERDGLLSQALRLEYLTVGWNVVEGAVATTAAILAGSVAILGFGIDSFVECASGIVMIWRLSAERRSRLSAALLESVEHRARRVVAASLFLLAAYVSLDALLTFFGGERRPEFSPVGAALLLVSIVVMQWLARAKRRLAGALGSEALEADAFQTSACFWLSIAALVGVGLNGLFGWWWADPAAALVIAFVVVREAREAWRGRACC